MLASLDWWQAILGVLGLLGLIGGAIGALVYFGRFWRWLTRKLRPTPPRLELESSGGSHSQQRDQDTGMITYSAVHPSFTIRNIDPVPVYAVTAGVVNPANAAGRVAHPQKVQVMKAETPFAFLSTDSFQVPPDWLAGFAGADPHQGVPYFVELIDSHDRKWRGIIDFREEAPRLCFQRLRR
jgi:hypothetical protein